MRSLFLALAQAPSGFRNLSADRGLLRSGTREHTMPSYPVPNPGSDVRALSCFDRAITPPQRISSPSVDLGGRNHDQRQGRTAPGARSVRTSVPTVAKVDEGKHDRRNTLPALWFGYVPNAAPRPGARPLDCDKRCPTTDLEERCQARALVL